MTWIAVTDQEGRRVRTKLLSESEDGLQLGLEDGRRLIVPQELLVKERNGDYLLLADWSELEAQLEGLRADAPAAASEPREGERTEVGAGETQVLQLAAEVLKVGKRQVERGRVRIRTRVVETEETVDEPLVREEVDVERVQVERLVEQPEGVRQEGDVTVIPLYEEVLVLEKRLMLTEELRVRKKRTERRNPQRVTLRREEAVVERLDARGEPVEGGEPDM
ncbi:YsnF/AvaK domain-containing protein [Truepera radiovictrix]|uniref:DUF2382 domain-containing protein n=1 Tax=Truepera radiovictrix (strain DSM 17093 / CIP 108686 / LMG 22925 / RQ-24) TaxID=649638 RepID=D7CY73_TRURR|nr:YsnF/AvaK domain-containing protein [Truepera radiovictrix]ADI14712.1 Domain of unknown function DUF2382 [Truepera radiovictrix DSM 17093]WMT56738.1 YsnF/AvaK domain-containing protein [Truepera radiovictrix]